MKKKPTIMDMPLAFWWKHPKLYFIVGPFLGPVVALIIILCWDI